MASACVTLLTLYSQNVSSGASVNSWSSVRRTTILITYLYLKQNDVEEGRSCKYLKRSGDGWWAGPGHFLVLYPVAPSFTSFQCWGWEKLVQEECSPAHGQQLMSSLGCLWGLGLIRCPAFLPRWEMWQCETRKWSSDQSEKLENNKPALLLLLWACFCCCLFLS